MDNKDTFYTISYKGEYIHGCWNKTMGKEEIKTMGKEFKSLHAAKIAITKALQK